MLRGGVCYYKYNEVHRMKKRSKLYAFILSVALLGGLAVVASQNQNIYKGVIYANEDEDCSVFYNDSRYTSLYEINNALVGGTTGVAYQTWGTVAGSYLTSSAAKYLYVQSTDKNGNVGCTNIYNVSASYAVGNVLKISGTPVMYRGMPEFVTPTIEVLYASTSYPITAQETNSDFWKNATDTTSTQFQYAYKLGPKKVNLSNVTVTYSSSGNGVATFSDTTTVPLYWGSQSNTTEIDTLMTKVNGATGSITGYVTTFVNGTTAKMQLRLREEEDISVSGNLAITQSNFSWYGTSFYNTGNYGRGTLGALSFDYYRAIKPTGSELMTLLAYQNGE